MLNTDEQVRWQMLSTIQVNMVQYHPLMQTCRATKKMRIHHFVTCKWTTKLQVNTDEWPQLVEAGFSLFRTDEILGFLQIFFIEFPGIFYYFKSDLNGLLNQNVKLKEFSFNKN